MIAKNEVMQLVRMLERAGWICKRGKHQHYRCRSPCKSKTIILASTPSDSGLRQDKQRVLKALQEG